MITSQRIASLTEQIRLSLFEMGLSLTPLQIDFFVSKARRDTLQKLSFAAVSEGLMEKETKIYCPLNYLAKMKALTQKKQQAARFWAWDQFGLEIEASMFNLALSLAYRYDWNEKLKKSESHSLWEWVLNTLTSEESLLFFEQWGSEGHPYHPNSKAKMGMTPREVLQYSPEFQARFNIEWLAIDKRLAAISSLEFEQQLYRRFPREIALWRESLKRKHKTPSHYYPIPVHPWQLRHTLPRLFKEQQEEQLILGTETMQSVSPTMSFRTVVSETPEAPHIKLATAVHTTSAMRTVSPASVHNGHRLSQLLKTILSTEKHFDETLYVMYDLGGLHACHNEGKHLSALFRENPEASLSEGERAVVVGALFARSPITHKPLLVEIIEASKLLPFDFFNLYCERLLKGQMSLYLKYGLALESHQQNTFMVFDKAHRPTKHLNRDLGGIRIKRTLLKRQGYFLSLDSSVAIDTEEDSELRNKFIHANLQSHIGYVIDILVRHFDGVNARPLWERVRAQMEALLERLRSQIGEKRYQQEKRALFEGSWQLKSLLRMRLEPCHGRYLYRQTSNPLKTSS